MAEKRSVETVKKALEAAKPRKFKESVEISINLRDVDLSIPKNRIDEEIVLPKGRVGRACPEGEGHGGPGDPASGD